jgi:moderate conductance mechanosensitive channel
MVQYSLGAVENMSRDWVIDKIAIGVTYDSDLNLAKKLTSPAISQSRSGPQNSEVGKLRSAAD